MSEEQSPSHIQDIITEGLAVRARIFSESLSRYLYNEGATGCDREKCLELLTQTPALIYQPLDIGEALKNTEQATVFNVIDAIFALGWEEHIRLALRTLKADNKKLTDITDSFGNSPLNWLVLSYPAGSVVPNVSKAAEDLRLLKDCLDSDMVDIMHLNKGRTNFLHDCTRCPGASVAMAKMVIDYAAGHVSSDELKSLLTAQNDYGSTPLWRAVFAGNWPMVEMLEAEYKKLGISTNEVWEVPGNRGFNAYDLLCQQGIKYDRLERAGVQHSLLWNELGAEKAMRYDASEFSDLPNQNAHLEVLGEMGCRPSNAPAQIHIANTRRDDGAEIQAR